MLPFLFGLLVNFVSDNNLPDRSSIKPALVVDDSPSISPPIKKELGLILKEIRVITEKIKEEDDSSGIESDWRFAAMVLDRLCLLFFTVFTILATVAVLWAAPHVIVT